VSLKELPPHVRANVILTWAGMALAALGILGFALSFTSVAGPSRWAGDVHADTPWVAWISIFAWAGGMALVWYGRRQVDGAVRRRKQELADAAKADLD
jgi:hypothetical protein